MKHILDLRGIALHSLTTPPYTDTVTVDGKVYPTTAHGIDIFLKRYIEPILRKASPIDVYVAMEGGNERREAILEDYKKSDPKTKDPTAKAIRDDMYMTAAKLCMALGFTLVKAHQVEADDVVALLVKHLKGPKSVWTRDGDLSQLYSPDTLIYQAGVAVDSFEGYSLDKYTGSIVRLYKSTVGDPSDKVKGVPRFGEKAFSVLVSELSVDELLFMEKFAIANDIEGFQEWAKKKGTPALAQVALRAEEWITSFDVVKLRPEWCYMSFKGKVTRPQVTKRVPTSERLSKILMNLGLESWVSDLAKYMYAPELFTASKLSTEDLIRELQDSPIVAFDYESYDELQAPSYQMARANYVDVYSQVITGVSFCYGPHLTKACYIPIRHDNTDNVDVSEVERIFQALRGYEKVVHNIGFEGFLTKKEFNVDIFGETYDTKTMFSHVNEEDVHRLKELSKTYLNYTQATYAQTLAEAGATDMRGITGEQVLTYGADDSVCTAHLFLLAELVTTLEGTSDFSKNVEPFFDAAMQPRFEKGCRIDRKLLHEYSVKAEEEIESTQEELKKILLEHCSEVNEAGFIKLKEEFFEYWRNSKLSKSASEEEATDYANAKCAQLRENCKYVPHAPPTCNPLSKYAIKEYVKSTGLPALRGSKVEWVLAYSKGMLEDADLALTEDQKEVLSVLKSFPMLLIVAPSDEQLEEFQEVKALSEKIRSFLSSDLRMWEGDELNIDSPKQMVELLYGKMNLPIMLRNIDKSDSNQRSEWDMEQAPSTNVNAVETWLAYGNVEEWQKKVLSIILRLRALSTKFKLYFNPYPLLMHPLESTEEVGVIRPSINNCGTSSRRPTSGTPNILQVSKKDDGEIRKLFLPDAPASSDPEDEQVIVSIDFVQQELVILAAKSKDENLLSCYTGSPSQRRDVHGLTGTSIANIFRLREGRPVLDYADFMEKVKDGDKECHGIRKKPAKITNFLTVYGGSKTGLARKATVSIEDATLFLEAFHGTYPGVGKEADKVVSKAKRTGMAKTMYGSIKHCEGILDKQSYIASSWERSAVNFEIQGTAADILKLVMRDAVKTKLQERLQATFIAPVYDEVVGSVPRKNVFRYCEEMASIMEVVLPGTNVKLATSVSIGPNWGEQVELGERPTKERVQQALEEIKCQTFK